MASEFRQLGTVSSHGLCDQATFMPHTRHQENLFIEKLSWVIATHLSNKRETVNAYEEIKWQI